MTRHGWFVMALLVAVAVLGGCTSTDVGPSASRGAATRADGEPPAAAAHLLWRPSKDVKVIVTPSEKEGLTGAIQWVAPGGTALWRTRSVTRGFGKPCLLGSYPDQVAALPYCTGGGTGLASYDWILISQLDRQPVFEEMGLWLTWSASEDWHEFRLSPNLVLRGAEAGQTTFEFLYAARYDGKVEVLTGTLLLCPPDGAGSPWKLHPLRLEDALSCVALLDCRLDGARRWASGILVAAAPDETTAYLEAKSSSSDTVERLEALRGALAGWYAKKED